jgi:hypothetical protein
VATIVPFSGADSSRFRGGNLAKKGTSYKYIKHKGGGGGSSFEYYAAYWIFSLNDSFDFPAERRQIKTVGTRVAIKPALC